MEKKLEGINLNAEETEELSTLISDFGINIIEFADKTGIDVLKLWEPIGTALKMLMVFHMYSKQEEKDEYEDGKGDED